MLRIGKVCPQLGEWITRKYLWELQIRLSDDEDAFYCNVLDYGQEWGRQQRIKTELAYKNYDMKLENTLQTMLRLGICVYIYLAILRPGYKQGETPVVDSTKKGIPVSAVSMTASKEKDTTTEFLIDEPPLVFDASLHKTAIIELHKEGVIKIKNAEPGSFYRITVKSATNQTIPFTIEGYSFDAWRRGCTLVGYRFENDWSWTYTKD